MPIDASTRASSNPDVSLNRGSAMLDGPRLEPIEPSDSEPAEQRPQRGESVDLPRQEHDHREVAPGVGEFERLELFVLEVGEPARLVHHRHRGGAPGRDVEILVAGPLLAERARPVPLK